jgi:sugar-specific transcriptional regulator TrmB
MLLEKTLKKLGFTLREARIYLACLEIGPSSVQDIAKKARVKRPTAYLAINTLIDKGLMSRYELKRGQNFVAEDPTILQSQLDERESELAGIMPLLNAITNRKTDKPAVRFYESREGLKAIYEDTLKQKKGSEILAYGSIEDMFKSLPEFLPDYITRRVKTGIKVRAILKETSSAKKFLRAGKKEMREVRTLAERIFPTKIEINIYENKMAMYSFQNQSGLIIEDEEIANTQKAIFEILWKVARK